jgi:hypothetical protein
MVEFVNKAVGHTGSSCQNCGSPSHCGSARWEQVKHYAVDANNGHQPYSIKACDSCRCTQCTGIQNGRSIKERR